MRKNLYTILVFATVAMVFAIVLFAKEPSSKIPGYKNRKDQVNLSGEWLNSKKAMEGLLAAIKENPEDYKSMLLLSQAYIQESRITGDHAYYDKAALDLLDRVIKAKPSNFDAICCKATVLLSQHHFAEGLELAKTALNINADNAFIYGILCDANVELGNYDEAVKMVDKMMSIRPDIRSYARASYLREIFGDLRGAIAAAKLAVEAGYPGLEQTEWTRCVLARLYENTGSLDSAEFHYKTALAARPGYAFAAAGLGRIAKAHGDYKKAISFFEGAKALIVEYSFSDELTDLYRLNNESEKANKNAQEVIGMLGPRSDVESEEGHGHYADRELAYAYLKLNDTENALKHAVIEYERRPANIDICETLAWVHYKKGNFKEASGLMDKALKTKCQNPELLCRAGLIKVKAGETDQGKALIKKAFETNPFIDVELKKEADPYLGLN
jgi:tetratricopeptide (TPR) repeat protein